MIRHADLGSTDFSRSRRVHRLIAEENVVLGGNSRLKIYGLLSCTSGKKLKAENRVFFTDETEAIRAGYRPCGHCMREKYREWMERS